MRSMSGKIYNKNSQNATKYREVRKWPASSNRAARLS